MSRQISEVEHLLRQLIAEHQKLLKHVEAHEQAMRRMDLRAMDETARLQEAARGRIAAMELRRRATVQQIARTARLGGECNLQRLAELFPQHGPTLLKLRDELKAVAGQIAGKTYIASRLAGAVLGHLNTAVRLLAGATEKTGVYTKAGTPKVSTRIGVMNAVG